ncbi:MAG: protein kinase [Candidatus Eremiobacterota bacterium]
MGEEVLGLVQLVGGMAAQCFASSFIKSIYTKSFEKTCIQEITLSVKELFRNNENDYTKTVLNYMKDPEEELSALCEELKKRNVKPEIIQTLDLPKRVELYELVYNSYLRSPLYALYKDVLSEHTGKIKKWIELNQQKLKVDKKEDFIEEGSKLLDKKDYDKAIEKFKEGTKSEDPAAFASMGNAYLLQGDFLQAKEHYLKALALKPDEAGYHIALGHIYDKLDLYDEADRSYKKAIQLDRDIQEVIYEKRLMEFLKDKKTTEKHREYLKKLLDFMTVPAVRAEIIEHNVKKSLGIIKPVEDSKKMKVILRIEEGPGGKEDFVFDRHDTFVVGRSKINTHSQLKGDGYISRHHFILELNPPYCFLKDLGSTNGTKVNDRKLGKGELIQLSDKDSIRVGKTLLTINIAREEDITGEAEGTLFLSPEVNCIECGKDVLGELAGKKADDLEGLVYTCRECTRKKQEKAYTIEETPVLCAGCRKDVSDMANRDGKRDEFTDSAVYYCPLCKPPRKEGTFRDKMGDYELLSLLGKGGMGEVYKAWHTITGRLVALKRILPMAAMSEKNKKLFQREMLVISRLIHPNIVRLYDQGHTGKDHYFAIEFLGDGDASDLLIKKYTGPVPYLEACDIICQSLEGLQFAHSKNYIHRDIKPQNILLHRDSKGIKAKLSDFGLAKNFEEAGGSMMTKDGEVAGTVIFMAPEQLLNYKYVKPPADVYSMGVSLYYLLTGKYPFDYPSPLDCMMAVKNGMRIDVRKYADPLLLVLSENPIPVRERAGHIPAELARVVDKSVRKREDERYASAREFREDILKAVK